MPSVSRPTVTDARNRLAVLVRDEVENAAGSDGVLQDGERDALTPFVRGATQAGQSIDAAVDAVMSKAAAAWAAVNQPSGPGKAWLSQAEVGRLEPALGALTRGALAIAATVKGTRPPLSVTLDAPAGVSLSTTGVRVITATITADVPVGTKLALVVDGQRLELARTPGGIDVWDLQAPEGYGVEVVSRGHITDPVATAVVKVTRDPETALTRDLLVERAKAGLTAYVKNERLDDADWGSYFPTSWAQAEAKVKEGIDALFANPEEVIKNARSITFTGRGPYDLYTEVTVDKRSGKVTSALVEID